MHARRWGSIRLLLLLNTLKPIDEYELELESGCTRFRSPLLLLHGAPHLRPYHTHTITLLITRTPRPCSVCGSPRLCQHRERRLIGARFGRWREKRFGRARCLTLRYSLLLSVWVDPSAEHIILILPRIQRQPSWFPSHRLHRRKLVHSISIPPRAPRSPP